MSGPEQDFASAAEKPVVPVAILVVVAVIGFIALTGMLGLETGYAGLLFFWYWGTAGRAELRTLPASLIGALGGTLTAFTLQYCADSHNWIALAAVLLFIIAAVIVQVLDRIPILFNPPFMLFLTVLAAPLLQGSENFRPVFASILLGAVYFGGIVFAITSIRLRSVRSEKPS